MSARLAWRRPWFRVLSLLLILFVVGSNVAYLLRMQPVIRDASTMVFHANVYVGIDDVRSWPWMFLWPAVWQAFAIGSIVAACAVYQRDSLLAYSILVWCLFWSCPWAIGLVYLFSFTLR